MQEALNVSKARDVETTAQSDGQERRRATYSLAVREFESRAEPYQRLINFGKECSLQGSNFRAAHKHELDDLKSHGMALHAHWYVRS